MEKIKGPVETPSTTRMLETPLAATHRCAGAKMAVWFGCSLPDEFGDTDAEFRYARERVALIDKNYRAYLTFTGPDRVRYLNAILTNNIKGLATGNAIVSLLLNPQGHILAEIETYAQADSLFCVSYAMIRQRLIEVIEKFIIMDDVTLTDETERHATLALEGPQAAAVVQEMSGIEIATLGELSFRDLSVASIPCRIIKRSPGGVPGAEFLVERGQIEHLWKSLSGAVNRHHGGPMGYKALSALRLAQGLPWFSYDFGEKQIPQEPGLQDSHISYTKGCYTGQEIVERVRSRGHANRFLVGLRFAAKEPPVAGAPLLLEGKEVGFVTRSGYLPALPSAIGMGYVRREYSTLGTALTSNGVKVEIIQLPIVAPSKT